MSPEYLAVDRTRTIRTLSFHRPCLLPGMQLNYLPHRSTRRNLTWSRPTSEERGSFDKDKRWRTGWSTNWSIEILFIAMRRPIHLIKLNDANYNAPITRKWLRWDSGGRAARHNIRPSLQWHARQRKIFINAFNIFISSCNALANWHLHEEWYPFLFIQHRYKNKY